MVGSKHTVYFAWDKIRGADIVGSINDMTFLNNRFSKLISLPIGTSDSVSYFLEFSCFTAIFRSVNPVHFGLPPKIASYGRPTIKTLYFLKYRISYQ